jgi:hypothetical protein
LAYQIERNLEFEDYICQINLSRKDDLKDPDDGVVTGPELSKILQVETTPPKRKWIFSHTNAQVSLLQKSLVKVELS